MILRRKCFALKWIVITGLVIAVLKVVYMDILIKPTSILVSSRRIEGMPNFIKSNDHSNVFSKGMPNERGPHQPSNHSIKTRGENLTKTEGEMSDVNFKYENIMEMKPIRYLPNFRNPCWKGTKDNGPINDNRIHCLPYFYVFGVKKCGTSDLFNRIKNHPDVVFPGFKEAQWFPRRRFGQKTSVRRTNLKKKDHNYSDHRLLEFYINMFQRASVSILKNRSTKRHSNITHICVTGEATPANLHMQGIWDHLPGHEGLSEPRYTNLHYIKHLIPNVKIIITFRNPVDRLYSDFLHSSPSKNATLFHTRVLEVLSLYGNCFNRFSFRHCMYNYSMIKKTDRTFAFTAGFYAFHMAEVLKVLPKHQVFPVIFENYISDMTNTLKRVYSFLDLRKLSPEHLENILGLSVRNRNTKRTKKSGPMLNKTKELLQRFYQPYNEEMAKLMKDDRFLFRNI